MQDEEWCANRPREKEFAMTADLCVSSDAVGTLLAPCFDICAHVRPEEAKAESVKSLEFS